MKNLTKYNNPQAVIKSNYYAVKKDDESCTVCGTCVERCQVHAIRLEDDATVIDQERCIGCGLCVSTCPMGSLSMAAKEPEEASPVFASELAMLQAVGKIKGKAYPFQ
jgi:electron transport complex protein RnfB